jgi:hypothetical protein
MYRSAVSFALVSFLILGCDKKPGDQSTAPTLGSTTVANTTATPATTMTGAVAATKATASSSAAATDGATYAGEYKSAAGTLYVPDTEGFKGFKYRGDKTEDGLGVGTLTLKSGPNGTVVGEGDGALGKLSLKGLLKDGMLTANVHRAQAGEDGYTGVLLAEEKDGALVGTMKLSLAKAGNVLREATVSLKKK